MGSEWGGVWVINFCLNFITFHIKGLELCYFMNNFQDNRNLVKGKSELSRFTTPGVIMLLLILLGVIVFLFLPDKFLFH